MTLADICKTSHAKHGAISLADIQRGAEFIEKPAFDYPERTCRIIGQTAFICDSTISHAKENTTFPDSVTAGYLLEQFENEQVANALINELRRKK